MKLHFPYLKGMTAFLSLLFSFCFIHAQDLDLTGKIPFDPAVRTGTLANGMKYYIRKHAQPENRAELRLAVNAGSMQENDDQQGLAHFCEHMAFNGTQHFKKSELVDYLESIGTKFGAHLNAFTSFDETVYMIQLPTDKQDILDKGFLILEDWASGLAFESEEIDKERGVVIEEWRLGQGADERTRKIFFPVLFKDSRYADRLPIGKKEILEKFPYEAVKSFYRSWYRPDLMAVVAVGDFKDLDAIETKIKNEFGKIPAAVNPQKKIEFEVPDQNDIRASVARDKEIPMTTGMIFYNHPIHKMVTIGDYRDMLVAELFSSMLGARLSEYLQKSDPPFIFASSFNGGFVRTKDAFATFSAMQPQNISRAFEILLTENERAKRFGFLPSELERAKKKMLKEKENAFKGKETAESRDLAMEYVYNYLQQDPSPGIEWEYEVSKKLMEGITIDEVNAMTKKRITDKNIVAVLLAPEDEKVKVPTEAEIVSQIQSIQKADIKPYEDKVDDSPLVPKEPVAGKILSSMPNKEVGTIEYKLSNGVRVVTKSDDFKKGEVLLSAISPGGMSKASDREFNSASIAADVISESGLGKFDDATLTKKLSGKVVSISPVIDMYSEGFQGSCDPADLETLMQLIYLNFTAPRSDKEAFESYISRMKGMIETMQNSPENAFQDTFNTWKRGNHPRYQPTTQEKLSQAELSRAYMFFMDRYMDASDFTFFFIGDFKEEEIKPLIEKYLGSLPNIGRTEKWKDFGARAPQGVIEKTVTKGSEPKSLVEFCISGPFENSYENRVKMEAVCGILRITLREALREEKGGTYFVIAQKETEVVPVPAFFITLGFGCSPENVPVLSAELWKKVKELKENGPDEKNVQKVKETLRREMETNLRDNNFWMAVLRQAYWRNENPADVLKLDDVLNRLTAKDIQTAAQLYLREDNYIKTTLVPEK